MTQFKVVKTEDDAIQAVDALLRDGYKEHEITIISKNRLSTDRFNDSEIKQTPTAGTISDKFMRFFIGEDPEEAAFTRFKLPDNEKEQLKQAVLDGEIVILVKHFESGNHSEVSQTNSSYDTHVFKHHPSEHKGDIE